MSVGGKRGGGYLQVIPGLTAYPPPDICSCVGAANLSVRLLVRFFQWYPRPHTRIDAVTLRIRPLNYSPFVFLMQRACLLLTDSGGVQEEAPALGKPVLVLRAETERPEAVDARVVKVLGPDRDLIIDRAQRLLDVPAAYAAMARDMSPYADGKAAKRIRDV